MSKAACLEIPYLAIGFSTPAFIWNMAVLLASDSETICNIPRPICQPPQVLAVASSPDVHLLRLFDEVVAEIRMRDRDQSLGFLPGRQAF